MLLETWHEVIGVLGRENLVIGGKSMAAAELEGEGTPVAGCVFLGYPFHAPGKPENVRADHLAGLETPCLILQGSRDPFGTRDEVAGYDLSPAIEVHYLEDGEHSFIPRKASGLTAGQNWDAAIARMSDFMKALPKPGG